MILEALYFLFDQSWLQIKRWILLYSGFRYVDSASLFQLSSKLVADNIEQGTNDDPRIFLKNILWTRWHAREHKTAREHNTMP